MRLLSLILATALAVGAAGPATAGDPAAGQGAYASCETCHGAAGEGNPALRAPRLVHLEPVYVIAQLQKFRSGLRGGPGSSETAMQMAGMAAALADEQAVEDVTAYIATLDGGVSPVTIEGDARMGGDYYNQFCGACPGAAAEGNGALNSPRRGGADDWYLLAQLQAFRSGQRGSHPEDRTGRQMRAMAAVLPDEQAMRDVVAFIRGLAE